MAAKVRLKRARAATNAPVGENCTCADEKDSAGTLLWQLDHDGDTSTADRCTGIAYSTGYMHSYTPYAYDGIVAFAQAATAINLDEAQGFTGPELQTALYNVSFEGEVVATNRRTR